LLGKGRIAFLGRELIQGEAMTSVGVLKNKVRIKLGILREPQLPEREPSLAMKRGVTCWGIFMAFWKSTGELDLMRRH
jgi:hypothetical protein